jgi:type VI secretion system protein ImpF
MADLAPNERLQPSLLDRLTDDAPERRTEGPEQRILSLQGLRDAVRRDLGFLLNSTRLSAVQDLSDYPYVERSVVNFGVPDLAGRPASTIDKVETARSVRRAILDFEPRLLRSSLRVEVALNPNEHSRNALRFDIVADLWCQPLPVRLYLRTDLNLEDGEARVTEVSGE